MEGYTCRPMGKPIEWDWQIGQRKFRYGQSLLDDNICKVGAMRAKMCWKYGTNLKRVSRIREGNCWSLTLNAWGMADLYMNGGGTPTPYIYIYIGLNALIVIELQSMRIVYYCVACLSLFHCSETGGSDQANSFVTLVITARSWNIVEIAVVLLW